MKFTQRILLTYISFSFNIIAIIVIIALFYKKSKEKIAQTQSTNIKSTKIYKIDKIVDTADHSSEKIKQIIDANNIDKSSSQIKKLDHETNQVIEQNCNQATINNKSTKVQEQTNLKRNLQTDLYKPNEFDKHDEQSKYQIQIKQKDEQILALAEQINLQSQRNIFLQNQNQNLKKELQLLQIKLQKCNKNDKQDIKQYKQQQKDEQKQDQIINLKNELQFCQEKLNQYVKNEIEMKNKLQNYEKTYSIIIHHPEYQRLKKLNSQYKSTISILQKYMLQRAHPNDQFNGLNLSFGDY